MIARRIIAVFLGVAAFCAIIVSAIFLRVNETVFSPRVLQQAGPRFEYLRFPL